MQSTMLRGVLILAVVLLAANLIVSIQRPSSGGASPVMPAAQAGQVLKLEGQQTLVTVNVDGDTLFIWQLGRFVNGKYEDVDVHRYPAPRGGGF